MSGKSLALKLLSASAFSVVATLRRFMADHSVDAESAIAALVPLSPDFASGNLKVALVLHDRLPIQLRFLELEADLMTSLDQLIEEERPWWRSAFPFGRARVVEHLSADEEQCFMDAGLLRSPPTEDVVEWWYRIQSRVRAEHDLARSEQGGGAELKTLAYERKRLRELGIDLEPELVGFEDNGLGYDVRSYDVGPAAPISRLIEVKSSTATAPRIIVPYSEWREALKFGSTYYFYLWHGAALEHLAIMTTEQIAAHVPTNVGDGEWRNVEITFSTLQK